jgi:hypothetical protein
VAFPGAAFNNEERSFIRAWLRSQGGLLPSFWCLGGKYIPDKT